MGHYSFGKSRRLRKRGDFSQLLISFPMGHGLQDSVIAVIRNIDKEAGGTVEIDLGLTSILAYIDVR